MKQEGEVIFFERLTTLSPSTMGVYEPAKTQKSATPFSASNAPGDSGDFSLEEIENLGKSAVENFNKIFS